MSFDGYMQIIFTIVVPTIISILIEYICKKKNVQNKNHMITIFTWILFFIIVTIIFLLTKPNNSNEIKEPKINNQISNSGGHSSILTKNGNISIGDHYTIFQNNDNIINSENTDSDNREKSKKEESYDYEQDELLIKQNWDLIQQLKGQYSDSDCRLVYYDYVELEFYEKAGCIYQNLEKSGKYYELAGRHMSIYKVFILDYYNDEIIHMYTPEDNTVKHSPENQKEFYCVVFDYNYNVYVTHPISVVGGEWYCDVGIILDKKGSEYTPLFQVCVYLQDSKSKNKYPIDFSSYKIIFECLISELDLGIACDGNIIDSGVLSKDKKYTYFSLNTDYIMCFYLHRLLDDSSEYLMTQTYDGSITDSNFVEIVFELDDVTMN